MTRCAGSGTPSTTTTRDASSNGPPSHRQRPRHPKCLGPFVRSVGRSAPLPTLLCLSTGSRGQCGRGPGLALSAVHPQVQEEAQRRQRGIPRVHPLRAPQVPVNRRHTAWLNRASRLVAGPAGVRPHPATVGGVLLLTQRRHRRQGRVWLWRDGRSDQVIHQCQERSGL